MNELVKVGEYQIGNQKTHGVNARDLWKALGVKTDFNTWIKRRLKKAGFVENQDYVILPTFGENSEGRPILEYIVGLDACKHVGLMEGNDKGKEVRQYFIECEKKFREPVTTKQIATEMYPPLSPVQKQGSLVAQVRALLEVVERQEAIEQAQIKQTVEILEIRQTAEQAMKTIEHVQEVTRTDNGYMPIVAYARKIKVFIDTERSKNIGFALSKYCKQNNIEYHKIDHPYYPTGVNTYPVEVLQMHKYLFV